MLSVFSDVFVQWCSVCSLVCLFIGAQCVLWCVCSLVLSVFSVVFVHWCSVCSLVCLFIGAQCVL